MAKEKNDSEVNRRFGENLEALRKKSGISRRELANMLDTTEMSIGSYERGIRTPNLDKILFFSKLFKVSVDELLKSKATPDDEKVIADLRMRKHRIKIKTLSAGTDKLELLDITNLLAMIESYVKVEPTDAPVEFVVSISNNEN